MIYVYILKSELDEGFYIGITKDIKKRIIKHNSGGVRSTKNRRPFIVIKIEEYNTYSEARKREIEIKSYKGGVKFRELINHT